MSMPINKKQKPLDTSGKSIYTVFAGRSTDTLSSHHFITVDQLLWFTPNQHPTLPIVQMAHILSFMTTTGHSETPGENHFDLKRWMEWPFI